MSLTIILRPSLAACLAAAILALCACDSDGGPHHYPAPIPPESFQSDSSRATSGHPPILPTSGRHAGSGLLRSAAGAALAFPQAFATARPGP